MSEEENISEEETDIKRMEIVQALSELGENKIANQLFGKIEKNIRFVEREDWVNEQICSVFPNNIDIRCLVFCCSPKNPCPFRAAVLRKLGLSLKDYIDIKKDLSKDLEAILWTYENGKDKGE
jgi:predicted metal-binding transcription factor (methanogenesis marker protein 9)